MKDRTMTPEKLKQKLSDLESKLIDAQIAEHERLNSMGFGYGMRHAKINFSTRKSDRIKERIAKVKQQIEELK